jgi:hypothetical protein
MSTRAGASAQRGSTAIWSSSAPWVPIPDDGLERFEEAKPR